MNDFMREEFEVWFLRECKWYGGSECLEREGDEYECGYTQLAFDAWQSAIKFIEG